jgi:uncharacterized protein (DUF2141 family)
MANGRLHVEVEGLRSDRGHLLAALYDRPEGFPREGEPAHRTKVAIKGGRASVDFADLAPGSYAIAVLHDENDNGKLDSNWVKIPKEGFGVSRFEKLRMSAPSFDDSKIDFTGGELTVAVKIHYVL